MHKRTDLAAGAINGADRLVIELIQPPDSPAFIAIGWPEKASIASLQAFPATANKIATLMAAASTRLAQLRRDGLR